MSQFESFVHTVGYLFSDVQVLLVCILVVQVLKVKVLDRRRTVLIKLDLFILGWLCDLCALSGCSAWLFDLVSVEGMETRQIEDSIHDALLVRVVHHAFVKCKDLVLILDVQVKGA